MSEIQRSSAGGFQSIRRQYEEFLWWTMDVLGVTKSIDRKVITAVFLQFSVTVAIFVLPFFLSGTVWYVLAVVLFFGAILALLNTVLIVRRDFSGPVLELESEANAIASGNLDVAVEQSSQPDEIGSLTNAFAAMQEYLVAASAQADALARQDFDDPALERDVPGEFGNSFTRMAENLEAYTTELEEVTAQLEHRSQRLETLVEAFGDAAQQARDGDLTATIETETLELEDDHALLVESYNELVKTLGGTVADVQEFADEVSGTSGDVHQRMGEVDDASMQVARSVEEISGGAARQTADLQTVAQEMNTLSATVEEIAASADDAATTAEQATSRSHEGREAAQDAIAELDQLEARINETATAVEELVEMIGEVDEIVSFIDEIAEQTNMLALNAGIEAARAGEAGAGFAVVADEVKGLAEETRTAAAKIQKRIGAVQEAGVETVDDVQVMEQQVSESVGTIETTLYNFEGIVEEVNTVNTTIQEISDATDEQAKTTQDVVRMVDEVASVSEETTAEAETVAAAAEEQTVSISGVTDSVRTLSGQADDLRELLGTFTVEQAGEHDELPTPRPAT